MTTPDLAPVVSTGPNHRLRDEDVAGTTVSGVTLICRINTSSSIQIACSGDMGRGREGDKGDGGSILISMQFYIF